MTDLNPGKADKVAQASPRGIHRGNISGSSSTAFPTADSLRAPRRRKGTNVNSRRRPQGASGKRETRGQPRMGLNVVLTRLSAAFTFNPCRGWPVFGHPFRRFPAVTSGYSYLSPPGTEPGRLARESRPENTFCNSSSFASGTNVRGGQFSFTKPPRASGAAGGGIA